MGATNVLDRITASIGLVNGVAIRFEGCADVANGGVLLALPSLIANGLLRHTEEHFSLKKGYYQKEALFILLGFMALARIKVMESLRYCAPGEWGKLLGIDRIPEVKTMRSKVRILAGTGQTDKWSSTLCKEWMDETSDGYYYIDGHVRVYYGNLTKLPRHYVSRQRLALRATVDYWVNAMDGQPFFLVNKAVDPGMLKVLREDIIPCLEKEVPNQLTQQQLKDNPYIHRFSIVFDREGYSPDFMKDMKEKRIACLTYNKFPGKDWEICEYITSQVKLISGEIVDMKLAERGTRLRNGLWVREIRKLTTDGHQTSLLATDYVTDLKLLAGAMFARWSQEAFFKYMRNQFNLDRLLTYDIEPVPDTTRVVNPEYKELNSLVKSNSSKFDRKTAEFGTVILKGEIQSDNVDKYQQRKSALAEEISLLEKHIEELKASRKNTPRHIPFTELPEDLKFSKLGMQSKYFIDTIKMIAYRAETSMANVLRDKMLHTDEARRLLQAVYNTEADIIPDKDKNTLTIRLHHLANRSTDVALQSLCDDLNATETIFPGTNLRLNYALSP